METSLVKYDAELTAIDEVLPSLSVNSVEEFHAAAELLRDIKATLNQVEAERVRVTGPAYEAWKNANDFFSRVSDKGKRAEKEIKAKIAAFDTRQRETERRLLQEAAEKADHHALSLVQSSAVAQGVSIREILDIEITDANLIPREFLEPNEKLIRATVKATKGHREIPGVRIFKKSSVASRAS